MVHWRIASFSATSSVSDALGSPSCSKPIIQGAVCGSPARTDLREPRGGNNPGPPGADAQDITRDPEGFLQRITAVGRFFGSTAVFRQTYLLTEAKRRFFKQAQLTDSGQRFLGNDDLAASGESVAIQAAIIDRLFEVGYQATQKLLVSKTTPAALCEATGEIDALVRREIDFQAFSTEAVVGAFNAHHEAEGTQRSCVRVDVHEVEALRQKIYTGSEKALKDLKIDYIMPNQSLAAYLCSKPDLSCDNILLKMGTGQGKSIVIAAVAAHEVRSLQDQQFVIVLTAYDHLAEHDHKIAQGVFAPKSIESACLITVNDVDRMTPDTKVIYACAKSLQSIASDIMGRQMIALTQGVSVPHLTEELAFLEALYKGTHRYILDEYDLILNDLDYSRGKVRSFPAATLNSDFVATNKECSPFLQQSTEKAQKEDLSNGDAATSNFRTATDGADGKGLKLILKAYAKTVTGEWQYDLSVGALRVSMLLAQAGRIIGLSGSAKGNTVGEVMGLEATGAKYFEIPSSRDPDTFGTRRVDNKGMLDDKPGIYMCRKKILATTAEQDYINLVAKDICEARESREIEGADGKMTSRPVLVFVNPDRKDLVEKLLQALRDNKIEEHKLRTKFNPQDLEGDSLQQMGFPGAVTLVSILCGRGVDIKVSPNIPDSMHVVLATNIISSRLETQIIGRTGRMGRDGSYSIITLGDTISTSHQSADRARQNVLHHRTKDFIEEMKHGCTDVRARKWLMRTSEIQYVGLKDGDAGRS